jgi:curved DNA-binding protein CbpA
MDIFDILNIKNGLISQYFNITVIKMSGENRQRNTQSSNNVFGQNRQQYRAESRATTHVDLYKVLGLDNKCTIDDIEMAYSRMVKQYHPDKVRVRHMAMVNEMDKKISITDIQRGELDNALMRKMDESRETYNLINTAYQRLTNDRVGYDSEHTQFVANTEDDYSSMRGSAKAFMDSQGTIASDRDQATFRTQWDSMNRRHNYNPEIAAVALKEHETKDRLSDLMRQRGQMDTETLPEKIFDPKNNLGQFNAAFERNYARQDVSGEIQPYDGINLNGVGGNESGGMFGEIEKVDNLYADEAGGAFASVKMHAPVLFTRKDLIGIENSNNTHGHNNKSESDRIEMKRRLEEHQQFSQQLDNRNLSDFSTDVPNGVLAGLEALSVQPRSVEHLEFAARPEQIARYRDLIALNQRAEQRKALNSQQRPPASANYNSSPNHAQQPARSNSGNLQHPAVVVPPPSIQDRPRATRG